MNRARALIIGAAAFVTLLLTVADASATHFRFATMTWKPRPEISATTVEFTVTVAFDRTEFSGTGPDGFPVIGDVFLDNVGSTSLDFGDFNPSVSPQFEVIAQNIKQRWVLTRAELTTPGAPDKVILHTYPTVNNGGAPWIADVASCCRISTGDGHINNPDGSYRVESFVDLAINNTPPKSLLTPIAGCELNSVCQFFVLAVDPDGDPLRWRLSTAAEAGSGFVQPGPPEAVFPLAVDANTGLLTWNTQGATINTTLRFGLYSTQVTIEDLDGLGQPKSKTAIDFFVQVINPPPSAPSFNVPPTPVAGSKLTLQPGGCLKFDIQASDPDATEKVTLGDVAVPNGMLCVYDPPAKIATGTCQWQPTAQQVSNEIVIYTATDDNGLGAPPHSLNIEVADLCSLYNPSTPDPDADGFADLCDNCGATYNPDQADADGDSIGDACDTCGVADSCDFDDDALFDSCDICPTVYNPGQEEADQDSVGDVCDNCPSAYNPAQADLDGDLSGDSCDTCPAVYNPGNSDLDADGVGDVCDNCPVQPNSNQANSDNDAEGGDECDMTITFPLEGDVDCNDPPPTVVWSDGGFDRFRAFASWSASFAGKNKISSGDTFLKTNSWTIPAKKWAKACANANPMLFFRVYGKKTGTTLASTSDPQPVTVK